VSLVEVLEVVVLLSWLSAGLAAVVTAPRNLAARALLAVAAFGGLEALLQPVAERRRTGAEAALLPTATSIAELLAVAAICALLLVYPAGELERPAHRRMVRLFIGLAVLAPVAALVGAPRLDVVGNDGTERANVLTVGVLHPVGAVGHLLTTSSDPLWVLAATVALVLRWRAADATRRRELRPVTCGVILLACLLLVVVVGDGTGVGLPEPGFQVLFLVGLGSLPLALLAGLSSRTRRMESELTASRGRLTAAEDRVRRSIERDLHDGVQQQLVAILSLTQLATRQVRRDPEIVVATLADVQEQVTMAIGDLRELVYGIRPPVLQDAGVVAALESRLERLGDAVTLEAGDVRDARWAPEVEAAAYFVVCEAVTNALKHAPGAPVTIRLGRAGGDLEVAVEDGGSGIPVPTRTGGGLSGLADRVQSLGGSFSVGRRDGGGTAVRALLPLEVAR
jgi:signal transduction histidine kinase